MSRIRVRLKPNKGIKVRTQTTYLYDPTIIDAEVQQAKDWATKTDGLVEEEGAGIDYSAKAYAIGGTGTETNNAKYYAEQAGISATSASDSATIATTQAGIATTKADIATTQAGTATTQAGIATSKASEASDSATTATTQALIATTQAGISITKAGEASTSATNAHTSELNASGYASSASTSETNASTSETNAQIFAEGSDVQVAALGGEKSSKGWAERAKELVDSIGSVLHYKGSVATRADLPSSDQVLGDMYNITSDGSNVVWNGSDWDDISGIVDLSAYRTASDQDTIDAGKVPISRTVNGKALSSDISLTASDVGALPDSTVIPTVNDATLTIQKNGTSVATFTANSSTNATANITVPTKTSDLINDDGFITLSALKGYATEKWVGQQGFLTSTALTGYATQQWVGQQGYITGITSAMVTTALGYSPVNPTSLASVATSGSYNDLSDKPTIPSAQVNSDWNANSGVAQILNKPTLATVATSGAYSDLSGKPTIPTVNNPTITLTQGGTTKGSFTLNQSSGATIDLDAGGGSPLPIQTGNSGKFLTTDGTNASWNEVLNYNNITNCITEIPQDIKLELNNGTLTLKAGSKVYVPNGAGVFNVVTIANDITMDGGATTGAELVYVTVNTNLYHYADNSSGTDWTATSQYQCRYNTSANMIKNTNDTGSTWETQLSFPIAKVTFSSGTVTSIDQVFNGFGYIGSTVFALPGVKGLIPNGRNEDGTLKNTEFTTGGVLTNSHAVGDINVSYGLNENTLVDYVSIISSETPPSSPYKMWYKESENLLYSTGNNNNVLQQCHAFDANLVSSRIVSFTPKTTFHAVDWNDRKTVVGWGMPDYSAGVDITTTLFNNKNYTAPTKGVLFNAMIPTNNTEIKINGYSVGVSRYSTYGNWIPTPYYLDAGDIFSVTNWIDSEGKAYFFPLKGVSSSNGGSSVSYKCYYAPNFLGYNRWFYVDSNNKIYSTSNNPATSSSDLGSEYNTSKWDSYNITDDAMTVVINETTYILNRDTSHDLYT